MFHEDKSGIRYSGGKGLYIIVKSRLRSRLQSVETVPFNLTSLSPLIAVRCCLLSFNDEARRTGEAP
jgi:hypothetical protein